MADERIMSIKGYKEIILCLYCHGQVKITTTKCPHCGKDINTDAMIRQTVEDEQDNKKR